MIKIPKLECDICGTFKDVPNCCDKSMIVKSDFLLCCCSDECGYQPIPECCGQSMKYIEY